ncbi:hypothetical protein JB92DRAFT_2923282 [Gautieria morchelliformis]|nr:hypothetical protein JB92DRAFT_2923282 [Gautieria morchelliformis]
MHCSSRAHLSLILVHTTLSDEYTVFIVTIACTGSSASQLRGRTARRSTPASVHFSILESQGREDTHLLSSPFQHVPCSACSRTSRATLFQHAASALFQHFTSQPLPPLDRPYDSQAPTMHDDGRSP